MRSQQMRESSGQQPLLFGQDLSKSAIKTTHSISKIRKAISKKRNKRAVRCRPNRCVPAASSSSEVPPTQPQPLQPSPDPSSFETHPLLATGLPQNQPQPQLGQLTTYLGSFAEHLLQREARFPLPALAYSQHFGRAQRIRLIELMGVLSDRLRLRAETQFLALDIFHRICTALPFERYHSALKAAAALYVAAKYEQVSAPQAIFFSSLDPLQRVLPENIVKMQGLILLHLDFNLGFALPVHFVELLAVRYGLEGSVRRSVVELCRRAVVREELWSGGGSLLAMAGVSVVMGGLGEWAGVEGLKGELSWRADALRQLLPQ